MYLTAKMILNTLKTKHKRIFDKNNLINLKYYLLLNTVISIVDANCKILIQLRCIALHL